MGATCCPERDTAEQFDGSILCAIRVPCMKTMLLVATSCYHTATSPAGQPTTRRPGPSPRGQRSLPVPSNPRVSAHAATTPNPWRQCASLRSAAQGKACLVLCRLREDQCQTEIPLTVHFHMPDPLFVRCDLQHPCAQRSLPTASGHGFKGSVWGPGMACSPGGCRSAEVHALSCSSLPPCDPRHDIRCMPTNRASCHP